ncbi:peptide deformylase [Alphaproteobacteria bacterium]|jgi:peptide deformylase|nr:peptide deformylase [Alphaproteobacteria bacterium]MDA9190584.1 peptide deformylase [Alphaproteobacteria bacterium]MDA9816365.1 peptide deformylase [Alphaproteobacteria bacterium]MDC0462073.1 peptide deformylase [Alphaproteobacteria bacterium]MDC3312040.1 peptide deformylase [Alphaproteobacteria bacterium]
MGLKPILFVPDPLLRKMASPVEEITNDIKQLLDDMAQTMYDAPGIGLAGPQIGELKRVIVMDCSRDEDGDELWQMINPEIIQIAKETTTLEEGCLSIPGHNADVTRPAWVDVRFTDINGTEQQMKAEGLLAACVQHEIDHLNGVLFIDHISKLKKNMIWRKVLKEVRHS